MPVAALLKRLAPLLLWLCLPTAAQGIDLPKCASRPTAHLHFLYVDTARWCVERVIDAPQIEPYAFTALAVAADGSLFAARPLAGSVMRIYDSDGDQLPDAMETYADGLSLPNGLAVHAGALYVAGGARIERIDEGGAAQTLVDDLPAGTGFWTGGLAIGADERLYVAVGAPCNRCEYDDPERGAILSMNLDGDDRRVVASGFRQPADLAFFRGSLWTLDSAPLGMAGGVDELNRVHAGGWYGFPDCLGEADCADAQPPVMTFAAGAAPSSLAAYPHDIQPGARDTLLLVLSGAPSVVDIVGYKVIMISFDETDEPLGAAIVAPYVWESGRQAWLPYQGDALRFRKFAHINELGFGFFPQQPLAVAVNEYGWIYLSMTGGQIIALRPSYAPVNDDRYPIWTPFHPNYDPAAPWPSNLDR
ncbi:MAG: PQQ-dependent sugar dehydrogenase [Chloroflexi bacterium]|nr:PQQ-dependent sugar dehydrogenase [Chloroflexota bacterium]MCY4247280.1 PQQ-dependent sugar dehydrogenase [Chloroflexota bacterium]